MKNTCALNLVKVEVVQFNYYRGGHKMLYVGVDTHKINPHITVMDEKGAVTSIF
jgi:hypothetical protein